jgi:hypothetical protein
MEDFFSIRDYRMGIDLKLNAASESVASICYFSWLELFGVIKWKLYGFVYSAVVSRVSRV